MVKAQKPKNQRDPSYVGRFRVLMMGSPDYKLPYPHGLVRTFHFFRAEAEGEKAAHFADMDSEAFTALRNKTMLWRLTDVQDDYGYSVAVHRIYGGNG